MICLTELKIKVQLQQPIAEVRKKRAIREESDKNLWARVLFAAWPAQQRAIHVLDLFFCRLELGTSARDLPVLPFLLCA